MLKIGEFSKLSQLTVKALRFYEKQGLLVAAQTDRHTGYRLYETAQLETAGRIKAYRQLGLSLDEIRRILDGGDSRAILSAKAEMLAAEKSQLEGRLSIIKYLLEDNRMKYSVTVKEIPEVIVYSCERRLNSYADMMTVIPEIGAECRALNPTLKCTEPPYDFCEYLDGEYKETDILMRHNEAVTEFGRESDSIKFRTLPAAKVLSILHRGPYDNLTEAYSFILKYAEENGYKCAGIARECYIDGIWNKQSPADWLTEIQLPIK